jgi:hypothetical protein
MSRAWVEGIRSLLEAPAPAVLTTHRQDLDELVEDDSVGDALPVAAERVVDLAGGQQAVNWTHNGSRIDGGRAGTAPPGEHGL